MKLISLFVTHPDDEFFVRELTRDLWEQINSVRRELDNLKEIGLLRSRLKDRKKYYHLNKNFLFYKELRSMVIKSLADHKIITKEIAAFWDIQFLMLSGVFIEKENSIFDIFLVWDFDQKVLHEYVAELGNKMWVELRMACMSVPDFKERKKLHDKFIGDALSDAENLLAINRIR